MPILDNIIQFVIQCIHGGREMPIITLRVSQQDKELIEKAAKFEGKGVSTYLKDIFFEKMEDMLDIKEVEEFEKDLENGTLSTCSHDEICKDLGLK